MLLAKLLRFIALCALALVGVGASARIQNAPLQKIPSLVQPCTPAQSAQVLDAPEEIAFAYGACMSGATVYYFDQGNRLVLAQKNGSTVATYAYDGLGRRLYASGTGIQPSRTTLYSQGGQMLFSSSQQGLSITNTRYVYLGGKLIAEDGTLGVVYNHTDALGSPVARTNSAGQTITTTSYEPYGKTAAGTDPAMVGFTGHVNDVDTGLVYMQQRYYDPIASRFMSEDPVTTDAETGEGVWAVSLREQQSIPLYGSGWEGR